MPVDDELLRRFLLGETTACRSVERWAWEIVYFKHYYIPHDEREDLVQQTIADVWSAVSSPDFALSRGLRSLVRAIAGRRCVDYLRRHRPTAELEDEAADPGPGPYEDLFRKDERARVRWALQELGRKCQELIRLHFLEELTYAEIAARREKAESTMRVHMFTCMKKIRRLLRRWSEDAA